MYCWLLLVSISYWYCLPVISTSAFGYNEFRAYDLLLGAGSIVLVSKYWSRVRQFFRADEPGKWLVRFCLWATVMTPVSVLWNFFHHTYKMIGVVIMDLYHLWGFALAYAAFRLFVTTRRQCLQLLGLFLVVGLVQAVIICCQSLGLIPIFWSDRYSGYGTQVFSSTLGMNRTLPGHTMLLVVAVAFTCAYNWRIVGKRFLTLALTSGVFALAGVLVSGSRTAWVVALAFFGASFTHRKLAAPMVIFAAVLALVFVSAAPDAVKDRAAEMYEYRVGSKLERTESDDLADNFRAVDSGRLNIWIESLEILVRRPWILPFGSGFINCGSTVPAGSAHNMYITVLIELGVVGFYCYFMWFASLWRQSSGLNGSYGTGARAGRFFHPQGMRPLLIGLMVSLLGGEILYVYRPCFAFLGMFLFVWAITNHPVLVSGISKHVPAQRPARKLLFPAIRPAFCAVGRPGQR